MSTYTMASPHADEFINHEEILDTLAYAEEHKGDVELCRRILEKAHPNVAPTKNDGTTSPPLKPAEIVSAVKSSLTAKAYHTASPFSIARAMTPIPAPL